MAEGTEYPIKTRLVHVTDKKTGVVYIEERKIQYDPKSGFNRVISSRRTGEKIMVGKTDPEPCRPKRRAAEPKHEETPSSATRRRVGMTEILNWAGKSSQVDKAVYGAFPSRADAEKILSVARFLVATNDTVNNIESFQLEHDLPYDSGISDDVAYELFKSIGLDETGTQHLFRNLSDIAGADKDVIAFDSTTISTYAHGDQTPYARQGYNKEGDGLDTYKMLTMFSVNSGLPISFEFQPGNIPDVSSVLNALARLRIYAIKQPEVVMDNGFFSKANVSRFCREHVKFVMRASLSDSWIIKHIDTTTDEGQKVRERFKSMRTVCPFDPLVKGFTITASTKLNWTRQRARGDKKAGTVETYEAPIHYHFYRDASRALTLEAMFQKRLLDLKTRLEAGEKNFSDDEESLIKNYLIQSESRRGLIQVDYNDEVCKKFVEDLGLFVLISNEETDCWRTLRLYRQRAIIEKSYETIKTELDGRHPRVWSRASDRGKEVCRLVALAYRFYLQRALDRAVSRAEAVVRDANRTKADQSAHQKAAAWLKSVTLSQFLAWFDCIESVTVRNGIGRTRWRTETTSRDELVLRLFMEDSDGQS